MEEDQFRAFYKDQTPRLVAMLIALGASRDLATDLAQDAMVTAFRRWLTICNPHAYVRTVALHELYAQHRANRLNSGEQVDAVHDGQLLLRSSSPIDELVTRHVIVDALAHLPLRQRQVMVLSLEGHKPAEIADIIGIEPQAVRASLHKARLALRKRLSVEGGQ